MNIISITFILSGLLVLIISIPLARRKVPMNRFYGMRSSHSYKSEESWYHLNEIGGMTLGMISFPLILGGVIGLFLPEPLIAELSYAVLSVSFGSIALWVYFYVSYARRYTKRVEQVGALK